MSIDVEQRLKDLESMCPQAGVHQTDFKVYKVHNDIQAG